ncbi:piggyBac transposable element-derived protein 3-like [Nilaparvata lugens]|uniref:piggyBac transposable element-derived protein 3-like n=1 Tax=Nilaparvata lugens TaxID=108931 RepID=UPI00193D8F4A|nr:piggyBac transposable element-derived protein 3-like [Nilaparvata lugens]XP_039300502.1 piggyBac transposable element-derived protein 3-like [Nilaparvata lugens]
MAIPVDSNEWQTILFDGDLSDNELLEGDSDDERIEELLQTERIEELLQAPDEQPPDELEGIVFENPNDSVEVCDNSTHNSQSRPSARRDKLVWHSVDRPNVNSECVVNHCDPPPELTQFQYFKKFFSDDIIEMFVTETNRYSVQKSGGEKSINTNKNEIEQFFGIHIMSGVIKVPSYRLYWANVSRFSSIADCMQRNRFDTLRSNLHVVNNENMLPKSHPDHDRLFKVRPFLNILQQNFRILEHEEFSAVDEMMIPFKGRSSIKQYVKNKPHKWGIKVFCLASRSGLLIDFEVYIGKGTAPSDSGLGLSGDIVIRLAQTIPKHKNYKLSFDNWFASYNLVVALKTIGILSVCTVRTNRIPNCSFPSDKELKDKGRGSFSVKTEKKKI